ncbi:MAG: winged helix-turn-helix transcriptional regulator [Microbacteriaceae bacterium]|nr:MAG: winged helix-turn-helix transcriptional regulator [Microbacteriaceae bacterium]
MTPDELRALTGCGETLTVEFKSDRRKMSNDDIVNAVVCLANGSGGDLLIGVEDDGAVTGAQPRSGQTVDATLLPPMIANRTVPQVVTEAEVIDIDDVSVVRVHVKPSTTIVGTTGGLYVRRAIGADGKPACRPFLAHEMLADRIERGEVDFASVAEPQASFDDLDPDEFDRVRRLATRAGGQSKVIASLSDVDLLSALEVAEVRGDDLLLRRGAIMLFGRPEAIRRFVPTLETKFQVLEHGAIRQNVIRHDPLFKSAESLYEQLRAYNTQDEVVIGLVRVEIDRVPEVVARELVANALVHRDYTRMGTVSVQLRDGELEVSSTGGFPRGVTLANFLERTSPRSRILADAFLRTGLVDRSGRGINRVFEATLRGGRPEPEYRRSDADQVVVSVQVGETDLDMVRFVVNHDETSGRSFELADLQIVRALRDDPRLALGELARILQRSETWTRTRLTRLLEEGVVEMRGDGRARRYTLSGATYRAFSQAAGYVRARAFDEPQRQQMILTFVDAHGSISRGEASELCGTSPDAARRILKRMVESGALRVEGERRTARYHRA